MHIEPFSFHRSIAHSTAVEINMPTQQSERAASYYIALKDPLPRPILPLHLISLAFYAQCVFSPLKHIIHLCGPIPTHCYEEPKQKINYKRLSQ